MENRIEQETNRTLECMGEGPDIRVSPLFTEKLSNKIADIRVCHSVGYRNRAFCPVAILLMVVLNFAAITMSFGGQRQVDSESDYQAGMIASEYGIGQSGYTSF